MDLYPLGGGAPARLHPSARQTATAGRKPSAAFSMVPRKYLAGTSIKHGICPAVPYDSSSIRCRRSFAAVFYPVIVPSYLSQPLQRPISI